MTKWIVLGLIAASIMFVGYRSLAGEDMNIRIAAEIRSNPNGDRAQRTMLVTLADGRMYPVNYLKEGDVVYMGIDGRWWREFVGEGQPVEIFIKGEEYLGQAKSVLDNPEYTADVFSRLRPDVPSWLPDWLNAKLVVISLKDSSD